jgi:glycosyltransferase involved in cell wall biosynthesis
LAPDPLLPAVPLTLGGLVFTSIFNFGDRRKNPIDMISAFLLAFKDREDVTLVVKIATNPTREHHEVKLFVHLYHKMNIQHKCRMVLLTDFLDDGQMADLVRATTFYVNASKAEGACLPLMQALAGGRPSIAPDHTSMADYMDDSIGFIPRMHPEPTHWPHDPEKKAETYWNRLVWTDLRDAFLAAADLIEEDPERYREMSKAARARILGYASQDAVEETLRETLGRLPHIETGRFAWAS